jgi:glycolate oxidase iron-sulfur subunit
MTVSANYDAIAQCNKCGFCHVACPIFRATGHENGVARGRLALLRGIIEKRVEWNEELEDPLFTCLGCGACTTNCFGHVPTADLVLNARAEYLDKVGKKPAHRLLFEHLLPYPKRLHVAARAVALGKNSGASKWPMPWGCCESSAAICRKPKGSSINCRCLLFAELSSPVFIREKVTN